MTTRSTNPTDLVTLPPVDASGALALGRAVLNLMGRTKHVPKPVADAVSSISSNVKALSDVLAPHAARARPDLRVADRAEDNAFAALIDLLRAFMRLPTTIAQSVTARNIHDHLVDDKGLEFLKAKPKVEWSEVQSRLDNLDKLHLVASLKSLGGEAFLNHLNETHAAYGIATGMTRELPAVESAKIREPFDALLLSLKIFYVRVAATVVQDDADSLARADTWLNPIITWEVSRDTYASAPDDPAPDDPAPDPTPT